MTRSYAQRGVKHGLLVAALLSSTLRSSAADEVALGLRVGDVLDQSNWQLATLGGMRPDPKAPARRRVATDTSIFDPMALQRFGK